MVTKIQKIDFFGMEDRYANYLLDEPATSDGVSAEVTRTVFTDQQPKLITVVTGNGRKTVEDYMGPPKGLYELEELILEITNASRWSGDREDWHDIPFYEHLPKNKQITLRALLQPYYTDTGSGRVNGYNLALIKNTPVSFELVVPRKSDLAKLEKYIVDATGYIKKGATLEHEFVLKSIKPVRRYRN